MSGHDVTFTVFAPIDEGEGLVEQFAASTYLEITGIAAATVESSAFATISAPLNGYFGYCVASTPYVPGSLYRCYQRNPISLAECRSAGHRFTLTRR